MHSSRQAWPRRKGEECFGNLADNLTAIVVYLHPPGVGTALGAAPPPAPAPAPAPAAPAIEEAQEDWGAFEAEGRWRVCTTTSGRARCV